MEKRTECKGLMHIKQNANRGFSLIELLIVVAIILIIAAIAIPNLLRSRMAANQAAAVATLRNINNSQATYISQFSQIGYADTFVKLGPGNPCDSTHACLVDEVIGCAAQPCTKSGYEYFIASSSGAAPFIDYQTTSTPAGWNSTGLENYCSMTDGVLRKEAAPTGKLASVVSAVDCADPSKYAALQ
jgi:prepilin-type N-terminal cleavage/methylation domain-containing protein